MAILSPQEYQEIAENLVFAAKLENFSGVVYCEAEVDKHFWRKIFAYKTQEKFDFQAYTKNKNEVKMRGAGQVYQFINLLNASFRICIDSDYYAQIGDFRYKKPFVMETQTYSIENHWCAAATIKPFLEQKYGILIDFDFEIFLTQFSKIIYKSFVYTVLDKKNNTNYFTIEEFGKIISYGNFVSINKSSTTAQKANEYLIHLRDVLNKKNESIEQYFNKATVENFETAFFKNKKQTYLVIQGHTLYDKIIKMILAEIKAEIKQKQFTILPDSEKANFENHIKNFTDLSGNSNPQSVNIIQILMNLDI